MNVLKIHLEASGEVLSVLGRLLHMIQTPTEPPPAAAPTEPAPAAAPADPPQWQIKQEREIEQGRLVALQLIEDFRAAEHHDQADLIRTVSAGRGWRPLVMYFTAHPSKSTAQALLDQGAEKELADRIALVGSALQILPPYWD